MSIKRYDPEMSYGDHPCICMEEAEDGRYVRYEDMQALAAELAATQMWSKPLEEQGKQLVKQFRQQVIREYFARFENPAIRWVNSTGVCGQPTEHDCMEYIQEERGQDCRCSRCQEFYGTELKPVALLNLGTGAIEPYDEDIDPIWLGTLYTVLYTKTSLPNPQKL